MSKFKTLENSFSELIKDIKNYPDSFRDLDSKTVLHAVANLDVQIRSTFGLGIFENQYICDLTKKVVVAMVPIGITKSEFNSRNGKNFKAMYRAETQAVIFPLKMSTVSEGVYIKEARIALTGCPTETPMVMIQFKLTGEDFWTTAACSMVAAPNFIQLIR